MHPIWYLNEPSLTKDNVEPSVFKIKGWIAGTEDVEYVKAVDQNANNKLIMELDLQQRPDIGAILELTSLCLVGFEGTCPFEKVAGRKFITIQFAVSGRTYEIIAPVHAGKGFRIENKSLKLERLLPYLICPHCRGDHLLRNKTSLKCTACEKNFTFTADHIDFLTEQFQADFKIEATENISENEYDGLALNYINRFKDGLILDCGAGRRKKYYENVVNYEIVPYPSTDVLGVAECIPFKDNTFDAVFSFAVLEHVKEPFVCAAEIVRVLKPGGVLYCQVPFLQPFHGYPHHYYNMTQSGLWNLFSKYMDVQQLDVLNFGQPIFSLVRFLTLYLDGLPLHTREQFMNMTIGDLLKPPVNFFLAEPFVTQLSPKTQQNLSFCNYLIASKKHCTTQAQSDKGTSLRPVDIAQGYGLAGRGTKGTRKGIKTKSK